MGHTPKANGDFLELRECSLKLWNSMLAQPEHGSCAEMIDSKLEPLDPVGRSSQSSNCCSNSVFNHLGDLVRAKGSQMVGEQAFCGELELIGLKEDAQKLRIDKFADKDQAGSHFRIVKLHIRNTSDIYVFLVVFRIEGGAILRDGEGFERRQHL